MHVDSILFELDGLDILLGMNFLTKYNVVLDCFNKKVVLKDLERFEIKFVGDKKVNLTGIIYMLKARKSMKGHTSYLA